jgi:cytidyltransferase-like protein
MKKIFVSGCYDILHGGHIQFFKEARALGDHLTVCFASDEVLWEHKKRRTSIPQDHKLALMTSINIIDQVVIGDCKVHGLDFKDHFLKVRPDVLVVTEDDQYADVKKRSARKLEPIILCCLKRRLSSLQSRLRRSCVIFARPRKRYCALTLAVAG